MIRSPSITDGYVGSSDSQSCVANFTQDWGRPFSLHQNTQPAHEMRVTFLED